MVGDCTQRRVALEIMKLKLTVVMNFCYSVVVSALAH
jgi:hypothetical protein